MSDGMGNGQQSRRVLENQWLMAMALRGLSDRLVVVERRLAPQAQAPATIQRASRWNTEALTQILNLISTAVKVVLFVGPHLALLLGLLRSWLGPIAKWMLGL